MSENWRSSLIWIELRTALEWLICSYGIVFTILCTIIALNINFIESNINYIFSLINFPWTSSNDFILTLRRFIILGEKYILLVLLTLLWMFAGVNRCYLERKIRDMLYSWLAVEIAKFFPLILSKGPLGPIISILNTVTFVQLCIISPEDLGKFFGIGNERPELLLGVKLFTIIIFILYTIVVRYYIRRYTEKYIDILSSDFSEKYKFINIAMFLLFIPLYYSLHSNPYHPLIFVIFLILLNVVNLLYLMKRKEVPKVKPDMSTLVLGKDKIELSRIAEPEIVHIDRQGIPRETINVRTTLENLIDVRSPIDIVILVDYSETMRNLDRKGLKRRDAIKNFIKNLKETSGSSGRLSLIYFNKTATVRRELEDFVKNTQKIFEIIDEVPKDEGATDYTEAFNTALKVLDKGQSENANIVFISDGVAECGGYNYEKSTSEAFIPKNHKIYSIGIGVDENTTARADFEHMAVITRGESLFPGSIDDLDAELGKLATRLQPYQTLWTETEIVECLPGYVEIVDAPKLNPPDSSRYLSSTPKVDRKGDKTTIIWNIGNLVGIKGKWSLSYSLKFKPKLSINCFASLEDSLISFKENGTPIIHRLLPISFELRAYPGFLRYLLQKLSKPKQFQKL